MSDSTRQDSTRKDSTWKVETAVPMLMTAGFVILDISRNLSQPDPDDAETGSCSGTGAHRAGRMTTRLGLFWAHRLVTAGISCVGASFNVIASTPAPATAAAVRSALSEPR